MGAGASKNKRGASSKEIQLHDGSNQRKHAHQLATTSHRDAPENIRPSSETPARNVESKGSSRSKADSPFIKTDSQDLLHGGIPHGGKLDARVSLSPKVSRSPTMLPYYRGVPGSPIPSIRSSSKWLMKRASMEDMSDNGGPKDKSASGNILSLLLSTRSLQT
jgi:hypothetical protein